MKTCKFAALFVAGLSLIAGNVWSRPVDLSGPSSEVGAADLHGYLAIWREIDEAGLQLDKDSYLPFRYKFSTEPNTRGVFGSGFYCPMFEARNTLIREMMMKAYLPCGKGLYLRRDTVNPNKFQTVDQEWTGTLSGVNGEDFTITRDDFWKLFYHQGRLTSITTDEGHIFTWDYDGNTHMVTGISEDGQSLVTVEPNQQGLVDAIVINGKRYELGYAERPLTEILLRQTAIKQLVPALSSFKYPDGKTETFKFALTPDRVPTLTLTNVEQKQTVYTWDAATSHIATEQAPEGMWTYHVGTADGPTGVPPITRTNAQGKTEGMAIDVNLGTYTAQAEDATTTITHVFNTPGPLYNKIRSIEKTTNGVTTTIYKASYDETGRLIREMDKSGFSTNYTYDDQGKLKGKLLTMTQNPQVLAEFKKKEADLLRVVADAKSDQDRQFALEVLGVFYVDEMRDASKALALAPQITDRNTLYIIKRIAVNHDASLNYKQKIAGYMELEKEFPEQKANLEDVIQKSQMMVDAGLVF